MASTEGGASGTADSAMSSGIGELAAAHPGGGAGVAFLTGGGPGDLGTAELAAEDFGVVAILRDQDQETLWEQ